MSEARAWGPLMLRSQHGRALRWAALITALLTISSVGLLMIPTDDDEGQVEPMLGLPAAEGVFLGIAVLSLFATLYVVALVVIKLQERSGTS